VVSQATAQERAVEEGDVQISKGEVR